MVSQSELEPISTPTIGAACWCAVWTSLIVRTSFIWRASRNSGELLPGQAFERFLILLARPRDDIVRQLRRRRLFLPRLGFEPVAHELLVERRRVRADLVFIRPPEARRIGRQGFVHQIQLAVVFQPEF